MLLEKTQILHSTLCYPCTHTKIIARLTNLCFYCCDSVCRISFSKMCASSVTMLFCQFLSASAAFLFLIYEGTRCKHGVPLQKSLNKQSYSSPFSCTEGTGPLRCGLNPTQNGASVCVLGKRLSSKLNHFSNSHFNVANISLWALFAYCFRNLALCLECMGPWHSPVSASEKVI